MHPVYFFIQEMNAFDLPPVCIITGERQAVVFKPVKFAWYPRWIDRFALLAVLVLPIAFIVASVMMKQVTGTLPFTEEAWSRWRRARVLGPVAFMAGAALLIMAVAVMAAAGGSTPLGLGALALGVALPVLAWVYSLRSRGPRLLGSAKDAIGLAIPSDAAAQAIMSHFEAGSRFPAWKGEQPIAADGAPTTPRCARHDGFVANKVCQRCGTFMCPDCEYRVRETSQSFCPDCWELRARSVGQGPVSGFTAPRKAAVVLVVLLGLCLTLFAWNFRH